MSEVPEPRPASTVVLLRDSDEGIETLMLKRNKALAFGGGLWVFPGGALEAGDTAAAGDDVALAARIAAAREAEEECGLRPDLDAIVQLSHWTTPVAEPKRFYTWIFAAPLQADAEVVIDNSEIHDSRWLTARAAIAAHEAGEMGLMPPTYVTLRTVAAYDSVSDLVTAEKSSPTPEVLPVFAADDSGEMAVMFEGDAGYDSENASAQGARHRTVMRGKRWVYVYEDVPAEYPRFCA